MSGQNSMFKQNGILAFFTFLEKNQSNAIFGTMIYLRSKTFFAKFKLHGVSKSVKFWCSLHNVLFIAENSLSPCSRENRV